VIRSINGYVDAENLIGAEDYATWLRISARSTICFLNEPLVNYTYSDKSLSRRTSKNVPDLALVNFFIWTFKSGHTLTLNIYFVIIRRFVIAAAHFLVRKYIRFLSKLGVDKKPRRK
jgi:hypothetical protein